MINVLHVHEKFYPHMGGSTHRLMNLLCGLDLEEFNIIVLCLRVNKASDFEIYRGIKIYRFDHYYEIPRKVISLCKKYDIHVIHTHNYRPTFYTLICNANVPHIMEMHSIYEPHSIWNKYISKALYRWVDRVVVLSNMSKKYVCDYYNIDPQKVVVILNGLPNNQCVCECCEIANRIPEDTINMSYVGSLDYFQGIDNIIQLINKLTNDRVFFTIVGGEKSEQQLLRKKIEKEKNVLFSEYVDSRQIPLIYEKTDYLLVLRPPCLMTDTAIPLKPIEALKNDTLVLSTKVKGMCEIAEDLKTQNILFFDGIDEVISYVNQLEQKPTAEEKKCDVDISKYSTEVQSTVLMDLYMDVL